MFPGAIGWWKTFSCRPFVFCHDEYIHLVSFGDAFSGCRVPSHTSHMNPHDRCPPRLIHPFPPKRLASSAPLHLSAPLRPSALEPLHGFAGHARWLRHLHGLLLETPRGRSPPRAGGMGRARVGKERCLGRKDSSGWWQIVDSLARFPHLSMPWLA